MTVTRTGENICKHLCTHDIFWPWQYLCGGWNRGGHLSRSRGRAGTSPSLWGVPGRCRTLERSPPGRYAPPGLTVCQRWPPPKTPQPLPTLKQRDTAKRVIWIYLKAKKQELRRARYFFQTYGLRWNPPAAGPEAARRCSGWRRSPGWAGLSACWKPPGSYSARQMGGASPVLSSPGVDAITGRKKKVARGSISNGPMNGVIIQSINSNSISAHVLYATDSNLLWWRLDGTNERKEMPKGKQ